MCGIPRPAQAASAPVGSDNSSTSFKCTRLNGTTFQIVQDDKYDQVPFIYAKVYESFLVLIDTGCGEAPRDEADKVTSLRDFLETYPVADNGDLPLNPEAQKDYVVICSHCHFDHIGGIAQFGDKPGSSIWASCYEKSFIDKDNLPTSSLCRFIGMETPEYKVTNWADDAHPVTSSDGTDLGLVIYHTPGHTPDEIAIWDPQERVIYVGDTMYEWAGIFFPPQADLQLYGETLDKLLGLVQQWNAYSVTGADDGVLPPSAPAHLRAMEPRVKIACGHATSASDAEHLIRDVDEFLYAVAKGTVEPSDGGTICNVPLAGYARADGKISFLGPKELFDEFIEDEGAVKALKERQS